MSVQPTGVIHDLGYKRYLGTRRPQSTRWRVITRNLVTHAWKRWWRYKLWLGIAFLITVVVGAIMVLFKGDTFGALRQSDMVVQVVDGLVFGSITYFNKVAFLVTLTVGAGIVASDLRTGAFTFYFARPVRTIDYVVGKFVGLTILHGGVILVPMLTLTLVRLGLSEDTDELVTNLTYVPKALLIGALGAMTFASVSLGFSSILRNPRMNLALWAGYYLIATTIFLAIGMVAKIAPLTCVDIGHSLISLSHQLFGVREIGEPIDTGLAAPLIALGAYIVGGLALTYVRVDGAAHEGIGGGS